MGATGEAEEHLREAWRLVAGKADRYTARTLFLRAALAVVRSEAAGLFLGQLKTLFDQGIQPMPSRNLAVRLRARRCRFEPIDLRVGVETVSTQTERERELQILKVCLAEIERSRPFLLVLLGDRYGWVPGEDQIAAASSEAGFAPEDKGASVTALEIEYGLLKKDPVQRRRCLLCLRRLRRGRGDRHPGADEIRLPSERSSR